MSGLPETLPRYGRVGIRQNPSERIKQQHGRQGAEDGQSWMMVYLDVLTLLLVMFVLLLMRMSPSQSEQPVTAVEQAAVNAVRQLPESSTLQQVAEQRTGVTADRRLADRLREDLARHNFQGVAVTLEQGQVNVTLPDSVLFAPGRADLIKGAETILSRIAPLLVDSGYSISVEGHTDNVPIATRLFPSNWELSAARAARVIRFLQSQGIPMTRMQAVGHADTRPLADNDSEAGRSRNRRVNLVVRMRPE